jgi:hypothetical protein
LDALIIYNHCLDIISASNSDYNYKFKMFALNALYNILSTHAGRIEFFNVRHVTLQGEGRQDAIERHQLFMLKKLLRYLERIPMVVEKTSTKGSLEFTDVHVPSKEGVDIVEGVLLVSGWTQAMFCALLSPLSPPVMTILTAVPGVPIAVELGSVGA